MLSRTSTPSIQAGEPTHRFPPPQPDACSPIWEAHEQQQQQQQPCPNPAHPNTHTSPNTLLHTSPLHSSSREKLLMQKRKGEKRKEKTRVSSPAFLLLRFLLFSSQLSSSGAGGAVFPSTPVFRQDTPPALGLASSISLRLDWLKSDSSARIG